MTNCRGESGARLLLVLLLLIAAVRPGPVAARDASTTVEPVPAIQEQLARVHKGNETRAEVFRELAELSDMISDEKEGPQELLRQLAYYVSNHAEHLGHVAWTVYITECFHIEPRTVLEVAVPAMELDEDLRSAFRLFLNQVYRPASELADENGPFEHVERYLNDRRGEPAAQLIDWMYHRNREATLPALLRVYRPEEGDEVLAAQYAVADNLRRREFKLIPSRDVAETAVKALDQLSKSDHWWVRMYPAMIVRRHREFRRPWLVRRLKEDAHPLVRDTVESVPDPKGMSPREEPSESAQQAGPLGLQEERPADVLGIRGASRHETFL